MGDLPHVTYVLLYDKAYVTQALDKASHNRGSEFLEKIVQIPAVVPELSLSELHESLKHEILRVGWRVIRERTGYFQLLHLPIHSEQARYGAILE